MNPPGFLDLMGFGPQGWGAAMLLAALVTLAVALSGFLVGLAIGALGAWAKLRMWPTPRCFWPVTCRPT